MTEREMWRQYACAALSGLVSSTARTSKEDTEVAARTATLMMDAERALFSPPPKPMADDSQKEPDTKALVKVICVDNHDREGAGFNDQVVADAVDPYWAKRIETALQGSVSDAGDEFFRVVPMDYKLKVFKP